MVRTLPERFGPLAAALLLVAVRVLAGGPARAQAANDDWLNVPNALAPRGPYAARIEGVWWYLFITATIVFVIVSALLLIGMFRRGRAATDGAGRDEDARSYPWIITGVVITTLILIATSVITFLTMRALAGPGADAPHTIEVVGKQWWWEIRYDGETIGANEIHVPVGEPVQLRLLSDNVVHSLWIPELTTKRDLVPGHPNTLWLQADEPGVHRGVCAEFCGVQHAKMGLIVVAEPPARFEAWLERARADAAQPESEEARLGQAVFLDAGCAGCHAVRGSGARGQLGPDLTHLASRRTLAAAHLPNTRGHLAGWIVDPQSIKPGAKMPPQDLESEDLQALLAYLDTLR